MSIERPTIYGSTPTENECQNCGRDVLEGTVRVFGDSNDVLHHCKDCLTFRDMHNGAGADPNYDPLTDRRRSTSSGHPKTKPGGRR